jgi:tetratricopeptide (TPR) repeat protein
MSMAGDAVLTNQVFVSHTSDMALFPAGRSFVQAALDGISRAGMAAVDMRYFPAHEGPPVDYCRQRVRECEAYIAVVGFRYGSTVPGTEHSYTEAEFREATAAGIPRLVFLLDESALLPEGAADPDRGAVERFRRQLSEAELILARFATPDGLEMEIYHALAEMAGVGPSAVSGLGIRHSLPPDAAAFTGRSAELERITPAVAPAASDGGVVAIGGMPGMGKTALAVHVAHRLRDQFPDRQLFIDLHAHTPGQEPVPPEAALASLLSSVGVDARYLPGDLEGRIGLWRDRMAGQRAVLVLDNAASSSQVIPLLPGAEGSLVLVTSRRHLGDLPGAVVPVPLDALPPDEARVMFLRLAPRAAIQAQEVDELVRLAGYLPLAISLLARVYAKHPAWTLADLAAETKESLFTLVVEKDSIAAAFDVSYRYLAPDRQRFFRYLGLPPCTVIDAYAGAALGGVDLQQAVGHLDGLHGEGLLAEVGYRRYAMHDLLRHYARDLAVRLNDDSQSALERLLDFYQHTAARADIRVRRRTWHSPAPVASPQPPTAVPDLATISRATQWLRAERVNLLACLDHATASGQSARVVALTGSLTTLLRQDVPWIESIARHETALQAARRSGDRLGEAYLLNQLGTLRHLIGDFRTSQLALREGLDIYADHGDQLGQANTLHELGVVDRFTGKYREAVQALETALDIYGGLGDRLGQANTLLELGACRRRLEGNDYRSAAETLQESLDMYRRLDDQVGQANALNFLGYVWELTGDYSRAIRAQEEALAIHRDLGNRHGQANALNFLGHVWPQTGNCAGAVRALEEALGMYGELGYRMGQANALKNLAVAYRITDDYPEATRALDAALVIYRDIGDRGGEVEALNEAGALRLALCDSRGARAYHVQALGLARELGSSWDEAHALAGLGRAALADGHVAEAESDLRQAYEIFQRISAAEALPVAAELEALSLDSS